MYEAMRDPHSLSQFPLFTRHQLKLSQIIRNLNNTGHNSSPWVQFLCVKYTHIILLHFSYQSQNPSICKNCLFNVYGPVYSFCTDGASYWHALYFVFQGKGGTIKEAKNFNADDDAKKIHEAIKDWGTNEQPLIDILSTRSNAQRQQIKKKYKEKYKKVGSQKIVMVLQHGLSEWDLNSRSLATKSSWRDVLLAECIQCYRLIVPQSCYEIIVQVATNVNLNSLEVGLSLRNLFWDMLSVIYS